MNESSTLDTRQVSSHWEYGWKRCVDVTRCADLRLIAGGAALRIRAQDVKMIAADCAAAERGVREGAWTDGNEIGSTSALPPVVKACVAKHRSGPARHCGDCVTSNTDYRFMEIVILPQSPVAALGAVVSSDADGELQLVPAGSAYDKNLRKFVPPFPAARAALLPRVRRGWAALEAAHGADKVFLACGRPSVSDAGIPGLGRYSSGALSRGDCAYPSAAQVCDTANASCVSAVNSRLIAEGTGASGALAEGGDTGAYGWDERMDIFNRAAGMWKGHDWQAADKDTWIGSAVAISLDPGSEALPTSYPLQEVDSSRWGRVGSECAACWQANC